MDSNNPSNEKNRQENGPTEKNYWLTFSLNPKRLYFLGDELIGRFEAMSNEKNKANRTASLFPSFDYYFYYYHFP